MCLAISNNFFVVEASEVFLLLSGNSSGLADLNTPAEQLCDNNKLYKLYTVCFLLERLQFFFNISSSLGHYPPRVLACVMWCEGDHTPTIVAVICR